MSRTTSGVLHRTLRHIRRFWDQQLYLQQLYLDRHELSGREAEAAFRQLRWSGSGLVGDWIPDETR